MNGNCCFDDLIALADADLGAVARRVSRFDLALALVGLPDRVQRRLLLLLTDGSASMVEQTLARLGGLPDVQVEAARAKLVRLAVQLSRSGRIALDVVDDFADVA